MGYAETGVRTHSFIHSYHPVAAASGAAHKMRHFFAPDRYFLTHSL